MKRRFLLPCVATCSLVIGYVLGTENHTESTTSEGFTQQSTSIERSPVQQPYTVEDITYYEQVSESREHTFINDSLARYGYRYSTLTEDDWYQYQQQLSVDYMAEQLGAHNLLHIAGYIGDSTLVKAILTKDIDLSIRNPVWRDQNLLIMAAKHANVEIFSLFVDAVDNINHPNFDHILSRISTSKQSNEVKTLKARYLIDSGYELGDDPRQRVMLAVFGDELMNDIAPGLLTQIDPNERVGSQSMLSYLVYLGASDSVVQSLALKLNVELTEKETFFLFQRILTSDQIKQGSTVTILLNQGFDPNLSSGAGVSITELAAQAYLWNRNNDLDHQKFEKLQAMIRAGGDLTRTNSKGETIFDMVNRALERRPDDDVSRRLEVLKSL